MLELDTMTQPLQVHVRPLKPRDYRCPHCARLIMRAVLVAGCYIEHRCSRCGKMCVFDVTTAAEVVELAEEKGVMK
jgi:phage FluMu protein Com